MATNVNLPAKYAYLLDQEAPSIAREAARLVGTLEGAGAVNNAIIVNWADEIEDALGTPYARWAADWYNDDSIPWCGLAMAVCAVRSNPRKLANRMPPAKYLSALEWQHFGIEAEKGDLWVGDIAVKTRDGGGHVTMVVGESPDGGTLYCAGGNQGDKFSIAPYAKSVFRFFRRVPYSVRPAGARKVVLGSAGPVESVKES